jgi:hypothetical protein
MGDPGAYLFPQPKLIPTGHHMIEQSFGVKSRIGGMLFNTSS